MLMCATTGMVVDGFGLSHGQIKSDQIILIGSELVLCLTIQEAAREREIEERERKLGALMAEKGSVTLKKKTSKVQILHRTAPTAVGQLHAADEEKMGDTTHVS